MNLDSFSLALAEISSSVASLTKKNYKASVEKINHHIDQFGFEAERHLLRCLLSHIDFSGDGKTPGKDFYQLQYLIQENSLFINKPYFTSIFCNAVDEPQNHQKTLRSTSQLLPQLSKVLKLNRVQEVVYAIALLSSKNPDTVQYATQYLRQKLPDLIYSYVDAGRQEGGLLDAGVEHLHLILSRILRGPDSCILNKDQREALLKALRRDFPREPRERLPVILSCLLYLQSEDIPTNLLGIGGSLPASVSSPTSPVMESSLAEMMMEAGYHCTATKEECRSIMSQLPRDQLNSSSVARVLIMMVKTPSGLGDQQQNLLNFDWKEVVAQLDHPGFLVRCKKGLRLLMTGLSRGLQMANETFPIHHIWKQWKNTEGQLSFILMSLMNPDIFNFADYITDAVNCDILKNVPNDDDKLVAPWKSINLVETLLKLSDHGHYQAVVEAFNWPFSKCPDILVLALLQTPPAMNAMKQDLISKLMAFFLTSQQNSAAILHYAWHHPNHSSTIRTLIMHAMSEYYMRGDHDQMRLSRILDVAQDLKALSMLLNASPYLFVIDLACLASRREYLKLDKWLSDKISEHKEQFISACVKFLVRRCPQLLSGKEEAQAKSQQLPAETIATMLQCLKQYVSHLTQELQESINTMYGNAPSILNKMRGTNPMVAKQPNFPQGMVGQPVPQMDQMSVTGGGVIGQQPTGSGSMGSVGAGGPVPPVAPPAAASFPQSMPPLNSSTPGSPARSFPGMGTQPASAAQGFNPMQSLASQFSSSVTSDVGRFFPRLSQTIDAGWNPLGTHYPNLNFQNASSVNPARNPGINSLASLSMQVASRPPMQPEQQLRLGNRTGPVAAGPGPGGPGGTGPGPGPGGGGVNPSVTSDMSQIFPEMQQSFSKEVEDQANSYFQQIYNHPPQSNMTIDQVLAMLKRFQDSSNKTEKDVFQCMLRNLFEEYRFFPQYPDRELQTTAVLFGGIIEQGIVTYWTLGIALRYILEALRKPHNSKMYLFGITALDRFKTRLKEYPQYCQHVSAILHFKDFPAHIIEWVEYGARSQEPPPETRSMAQNVSVVGPTATGPPPPPVSAARATTMDGSMGGGGAIVGPIPNPLPPVSATAPISQPPPPPPPASAAPGPPPSVSGGRVTFPKPSIATATNIDTLLAGQQKEEILVPPETLQDKIFFIFNNLSLANMKQKGDELKEHVGEEYVPWVAQYLVMKRASIEPNFHTLYSGFIDILSNPALTKMVTSETFRNIKVLLRSDKGAANFSDRTLLKNLGHWLGMITLAKNKPILKIDIDLKSLIYEAYHKGAQELLYVVPFSAKVLESCAKSLVFRVPSPWTMAIMNVLAELHQEPELKLNLKFEIEVLCKTLSLDVNDLKPSSYLGVERKLDILYLSKPPPPLPPKEEEVPLMAQQPPPNMPPFHPVPVSMPPPMPLPVAQMPGMPPSMPPPLPQALQPQPQPPPPLPQPPPHMYPAYDAINTNISTLPQQLTFNDKHPFLQANPMLIQLVRPTIERTIQELLSPVVERSIKIALTTCEQIIKKDFSLESDEARVRSSAQYMMRNIACGLALITAREPVHVQITGNLIKAFSAKFMNNPPPKEIIEQAVGAVAADVVDFCTAFIQKTTVEKAAAEIDKRLTNEFEIRRTARRKNQVYFDPQTLAFHNERIPEQIRLKVNSVTPQQLAVYDEFSRSLPGFMPANMAQHPPPQPQPQQPPQPQMMPQLAQQPPPPNVPPPPQYGPDEMGLIYERIVRDLEQHLQVVALVPNNPLALQLHALLEAAVHTRNTREPRAANLLLQKAVEGLLDHFSPSTITPDQQELALRFRECHLMVLKGLADARALGPGWAQKEVTRCLIISGREESKYNLEAVEFLLRSGLILPPQFDIYLNTILESGAPHAANFVLAVVSRVCTDDKSSPQSFTEADFPLTVDALNNFTRSRQSPQDLENVVPNLRMPGDTNGMTSITSGNAATMMQSGISQAREFDDPPGLHEKTEYLLREWVNMYHSPAAGRDSTKAFTCFVQQMHQQGILKTDDLITRFFRLCTEMCVDLCYRALGEQSHSPTLVRAKCFHTLDAFVRLIALLVKHSGDNSNTMTKINLLNKVLGIVAGVLIQDHEVRFQEFQQLPYHRIFIMLFIELNAPEPILESINLQVLAAFCQVFHILRPSKAPAFAFAWMELISHRVFIGRLLALTPGQRGWGMYAQLLMDLFKFLAPFLRNAELSKSAQLLYKGTLRVLLVLLHDFPDFLCDYPYMFCDVIPPNCIQMRNLILSAYPRNMRLPDPFTPNLKVDNLPDITQAPRITSNYISIIQPASFKKELDSYLKSRSPITFLSDLKSNLQSTESGCHYNIQLINALVLYVGTQAIQMINSKGQTPSINNVAPSPHMDIFQNLAVNLDTEGRYLLLTAIANQLRYPNSHTHYFSCCLLYLFAQAHTEAVQEQITRVLLERLIVNRPHPWGLLITFIELIKNPAFKFWSHEFVHCAPEIEKLFESVARSCTLKTPTVLPEATEVH